MIEPRTFQETAALLQGWDRTLLITHERPDGDALGAIGAMKRLIEAGGRQATAVVSGSVPARYAFIEHDCGLEPWQPASPAELDARFDGIVICDTSSWVQLETAADFLRASHLPRIVVDHHATGDRLTGDGARIVHLIDPAAASACELVCEWAESVGWPIDAVTGQALLAGLTADTGWFRFSNTRPATLRAAARLVEAGVRPDVLYARLYESWSPARLHLKAGMLATLEFLADGRLAVMHLTRAMFAEAGAELSDSEELVNEPMAAGTTAVTVLLSDLDDGRIRTNFRSKAPEVCGLDVDVAALAQRFGGGGHRRAAGARLEGPLADARKRVIQAAIEALAEAVEHKKPT